MNEELEKDMTPLLIEDLGMRYATERSPRKYRYGLYECPYCGKEFEAQTLEVKRFNTKSCGCLHIKHGMWQHRLYDIWYDIIKRVTNPKHTYYNRYGGRGINVCDEWVDIRNFIKDMYPTFKEGLTLDRIDNDKGYSPENCRWVTRSIQGMNTSGIRESNTSGYRGVSWHKGQSRWIAHIGVEGKLIHLGYTSTALEAAKLYETYVRENGLEHNYTPSLSTEEINILNKKKEVNVKRYY